MTGFHNHSKVFDFGDVKLAFLKLQVKVELSHTLEDMTGLFFVSFWVRRDNEEIVHVDDEPSLSNHVPKRVVHELLECGRGVAEAKEHDRL